MFLRKMQEIKENYFIFDFKKLKINPKDFRLVPAVNTSSNLLKKKSISSLLIIKEGDTNKWFEFESGL